MPASAPKRPKWWFNSYFWFTALLVMIAVIGIVSGEESIRDPGQTKDRNLVIIYLVGAAIMFAGGYMSHTIALRAHAEELEEFEKNPSAKGAGKSSGSIGKKSVAVPTADPEPVFEEPVDEVRVDGPISDIPENEDNPMGADQTTESDEPKPGA